MYSTRYTPSLTLAPTLTLDPMLTLTLTLALTQAQSWRPGSPVDGIEAGCYAWSLAAFGALEQEPALPSTAHPSSQPPVHSSARRPSMPRVCVQVAASRSYFTLAHAMNAMAVS